MKRLIYLIVIKNSQRYYLFFKDINMVYVKIWKVTRNWSGDVGHSNPIIIIIKSVFVVQCRKRFHPGRDGVQIFAPLPAGLLRSYIAIVPFNCIFLLSSLYLFFNNWKDLLHRYLFLFHSRADTYSQTRVHIQSFGKNYKLLLSSQCFLPIPPAASWKDCESEHSVLWLRTRGTDS